jgi:FkbM family methyltransferase
MSKTTIYHDFNTGRITGGGVLDRIGIELMRIAAFILAPFEFVGFSWAAALVRSIFRGQNQVQVKLSGDSVFEYPYGDGYWGTLLYNKMAYSPEIEGYLKSFADIDYAFIDCGSNFGYMSVVVSSDEFGNKPAIAIEADPENYQKTVQNANLNGKRFDHCHNAVFNESGKKVTLFGAKHEAFSLRNEAGDQARAEVETLALDDLSGWLEQQGNPKSILKLDVEGVEIDALKGAGKILENDCLVIYEEHGADMDHEISRYLKDQLDMRLYFGSADGKNLYEITSYDEITKLKTSKRVGYDLFATSSEFWVNRLDQLMQNHRTH